MRKPRAADRPCYFIILLWLRSGCFAHRSSQTNNRSSPIVTETPTKHCTPLALALKLVPSGCRQSMQLHCTKGAELPVSASRTPPHCEGHSCLLSAPQRWGDDGNPPTLPHSGHGVRYVAPRGGYRLLSPARECGGEGECSCEAGIRSNKEGALRE